MIQDIVSTGSAVIDELIGGGLEADVITTIYGPAGVGKSNLALQAAVATARIGKQVLFIDTEGSFSYTRLVQMTSEHEAKRLLDRFLFLKPTSFEEQKKIFHSLPAFPYDNIGLIVVDSIAMLYRLQMGMSEDVSDVNRELSQQIGILTEITRKNHVPVIITNQVYANFEDREKVSMVGGDILKYGSKCLVEFKMLQGKRKAVLVKHRSQPEGKFAIFEIREKGIFEATHLLETHI